MYFKVTKNGDELWLDIVESYREAGNVRQHHLYRVGSYRVMSFNGQLLRLKLSLNRLPGYVLVRAATTEKAGSQRPGKNAPRKLAQKRGLERSGGRGPRTALGHYVGKDSSK